MAESLANDPMSILRALVEWDKRWPKNSVYNSTDYAQCHVELDGIVKDALTALDEVKP